ncbi:MAG: hypothetical protein ACHQAV_04205 [Solirubrobacterales bacterium]
MQDRSPVADGEEHRESFVLTLLLDPDSPCVWSIDELARELGDPTDAADAVARLYAAGLVHRCGEFVFATRSAARFARLIGGL